MLNNLIKSCFFGINFMQKIDESSILCKTFCATCMILTQFNVYDYGFFSFVKKHGIKKIISACLVAALLATSSNVICYDNLNGVYADELSDAEAKKEDASQRKKDAQAKLENLKKNKEDTIEMIAALDKEICDYYIQHHKEKDE